MAIDEERQTATTEHTPLLGTSIDAVGDATGVDDDNNTNSDTSKQDAVPQPKTRSWYARRVFWTLLPAGILFIFIKGWVDAGGDVDFNFKDALKRALGSGVSGAAAMVLQVLLLMYRFGHSFTDATTILYGEGGFGRYYDGLGAALIQGPVSRFGDTAANAGILALLASNSYLKDLPSPIKTVFVSLCAASFRLILTPIDTVKTTLQAQGARGTALLRQRIKTNGIGSMWWGALATAAATFAGNYPWFATYNLLTEAIPEPARHPLFIWLLRLAFIGFVASVVSDTVSNSLRVVKTYRQVNDTKVSYTEAAALVIQADGLIGLFGRGLKTRILSNGLQGLLFSILWKLFLDLKLGSSLDNNLPSGISTVLAALAAILLSRIGACMMPGLDGNTLDRYIICVGRDQWPASGLACEP